MSWRINKDIIPNILSLYVLIRFRNRAVWRSNQCDKRKTVSCVDLFSMCVHVSDQKITRPTQHPWACYNEESETLLSTVGRADPTVIFLCRQRKVAIGEPQASYLGELIAILMKQQGTITYLHRREGLKEQGARIFRLWWSGNPELHQRQAIVNNNGNILAWRVSNEGTLCPLKRWSKILYNIC